MEVFKSYLKTLLFPTVMVLSIATMLRAINLSLNVELISMLIAVVIIAVVHISERIVPFREEWNKSRGDFGSDLLSLTLILAVLEPLIKIITLGALSYFLVFVSNKSVFSLFPSELPLLAQLVVFAIFTELGRYWIHRWSHLHEGLWHIHASHHSAERLYQFNGYRTHPFNYLWNYLLGQFPLVLMGAGQDVIMLYFVFSAVAAAFQHANINSNNGLLNYIFSTNELHRWHHSTQHEEGNSNYGSVLIVWDLVFGTYYSGKLNTLNEVGLASPKNYPINNYLKQLVVPFCWQKCVVEDAHKNN